AFLVWAFIVEAIIIIIITMITKPQNPQNLNLKVSRKEYPLNQVGPLLQIIQPVEVGFQKAFPIDQMHHHLAIQEAKKVFQGVYLVDPAEGHLHLTAQEAKAFQEASRVRALISL
ncbi:MAG: hypothetical protein VX848_00220, partial [Verrucomicrobiota bacterium]|nr:hypothetical protein [Verrucomicrobiota bacterium]